MSYCNSQWVLVLSIWTAHRSRLQLDIAPYPSGVCRKHTQLVGKWSGSEGSSRFWPAFLMGVLVTSRWWTMKAQQASAEWVQRKEVQGAAAEPGPSSAGPHRWWKFAAESCDRAPSMRWTAEVPAERDGSSASAGSLVICSRHLVIKERQIAADAILWGNAAASKELQLNNAVWCKFKDAQRGPHFTINSFWMTHRKVWQLMFITPFLVFL